MIQILHKIRRDERGASIIEMALVAPFLATLTIGMVDLSRAYSEKLFVEQAAQRAVERAMQGMQGDESTDIFEGLQAEAAETADVDADDVTVRYWLECNGVEQNASEATMADDYEKVCPDGQYYSRHISVSIEKTYTPMFSTKWLGANADGTLTFVGEAGMRVQ